MAAATFFRRQDSKIRKKMQRVVRNFLFPVGAGDWYAEKGYGSSTKHIKASPENAFNDFAEKQRDPKARYYHEFSGLDLSLNFVPAQLTNHKTCKLEVMKCAPQMQNTKLPGNGKHIVYFPGANTYYQACFRDISAAAKETGATVHALNYPGTGASTGEVTELNDLINAGMAVVNDLIKSGVKPDDIILQGDCYGAGIALEVKKQFEEQSQIQLRIIMNNAFKSFKAVVVDMIKSTAWLPNKLSSLVKKLLEYTGWHITPGKKFEQSGPYQCFVQHLGDQTLTGTSLADKVHRFRYEATHQVTKSTKRDPVKDTCPEEYRKARDELELIQYVRVKENLREAIITKFGADSHGQPNAHFADLGECETLDGTSAYTGFVNKYLAASNAYIANHPQADADLVNLPKALDAKKVQPISASDYNKLVEVAEILDAGQTKRATSRVEI